MKLSKSYQKRLLRAGIGRCMMEATHETFTKWPESTPKQAKRKIINILVSSLKV